MVAIPTLRHSENANPPLSARQESGWGSSNERHWGGRWVPRDAHGQWTGENAYYGESMMRREYPDIVLLDKDGSEYV